MDRQKASGVNRSQKKLSGHHGSEFYALGNKCNRDDPKAKIVSIKSANSTMDRKREAPSALTNVAKKPKFNAGPCDVEINDTTVQELLFQKAADCEVEDLVQNIISAIDKKERELVLRLLCGCIRNITIPYMRLKQDPLVYLILTYVCKIYPCYFQNDVLTSALVSILRRETNLKNRQIAYSHVAASNLLMRSYCNNKQWPDVFLRIYVEDAINERIWVDNILCACFIENITLSFQTTIPINNVLLCETGSHSSTQQNRETAINIDDDSSENLYNTTDANLFINVENKHDFNTLIENRYNDSVYVEKIVTDAIKDQLNKRQQPDCYTRNFLKFLCSTSGLVEVRYLCISRLELWIHNGKLVKLAQQLLSYICANVNTKYAKDQEVLAILIKMRFKTKPLINFYMTCFKELIIQKPDLLYVILKFVVQNELSNTRNPNNMGMLAAIFQTNPDKSASHLADIYKEFLLQRDDCLRTLRVFLRELVRMLRFDINISMFCKVFLNGRANLNKQIEQFEFRDRIFHSMVDITCLCMLLSASPQVREASISLRTSRENKMNPVLAKFYSQMSEIQLDAISWMYETVPNLFKLQTLDYSQSLHKILLLENAENYSRCDQWPSEAERTTLLRIVSETPIHEETLLRIILIGITKDIPFTISDTIDILMLVIKRVSSMRSIDYPAINVNKFDIIDFLFSMTEYHHPENIKLPDDYDPPKLAITILYWKAWLIMVMISAHNPSTFGAFCWEHYPTMKALIEMCITNQFNDVVMSKDELQILSIERDHILEFETYLAAQTSQAVITEENAILITQLMLMDPMGPARRVPPSILDQLQYLNKSLKLGHLLCRSRKPDLLLDIIDRQGTTQSMPWLSDLVQNSEGEFNNLPVQCLCEFLMFNASIINEENCRDAELVNFLRNLILEPNSNSQTVCEILDYIFRRLSSSSEQSRQAALDGIKLIFKLTKLKNNNWLLKSLPQNPHFANVKEFIIPQLRSACQVENSPDLVMSYIQFIAAHTLNDSVAQMLDHVIDMSQLIVERSTMFQHIIPKFRKDSQNIQYENRLQTLKCLFVMFNNYIIKLREHHDSYEWTEYPDLLMVEFDDGMQLPLHLNIIHAFIILLTHSNHAMSESKPILEYWFPPGRSSPNAYLLNATHEQVQLLPDWLKLKMIRSSVDQLTEAALHELLPDQIVLFVQNFGTPVNSMSKLLALLDHAVIAQYDAVKNAILNKAYLSQLIEIQRARGAKNGHFTVQTLELHCYPQTLSETSKSSNDVLEIVNDMELSVTSNYKTKMSPKETKDIIQSTFKNIHFSNFNNYCFRQLLNYLLNRYSNNCSQQLELHTFVEYQAQEYLKQLSTHASIDANDPPSILQNSRKCTFFRVLRKVSTGLELDCTSAYKSNLLDKKNTALFRYYLSLSNILQCRNSGHNLNLVFQPQKGHLKELNLWNMISKYFLMSNVCNDKMDHCDNTHTDMDSNNLRRDGHLVDWFIETDPEFTIASAKNLQINSLFSKTFNDFRYHLLSRICHQTNWKTLVFTLYYLLQEPKIDFDYNTVLNFFEALISNPKLWQGSDKSISKVNQQETILSLSKKELDVFTQFIFKEGESEIDINLPKYNYKLCSRINVLLKSINKRSCDMVNFIDCVFKYPSTQHKLKHKIFQQVYLMYPSIIFIKFNKIEKPTKLQTLKGCQADKVSNSLITCLGSLILKKDFESLSSDTELLIRKLAASHPALFLRQLGVLITVIQGKAQLNLRALREGYHFHRFVQVLRILELLQPMIFDDVYKKEFFICVECYLTFFKSYSYVKDVYQILVKFVELLHKYINTNPSSSIIFIERYVGMLMDLSIKFNSVGQLHKLLQAIALLQHNIIPPSNLNVVKHEMDLEDESECKSVKSTITLNDESSEFGVNMPCSSIDISPRFTIPYDKANRKGANMSPHLLNLIKIIKHSNMEDTILGPLQEIESLTSKRFSFLSDLFNRLLELIFSQSAQIRSNAFILLIRHLKHNPGCSDINQYTLNAYIQCLRDENSSVASTAVDNLTEMTILLHEHAVKILTVAFSLGVRSRLNTCTQIKRILQTLQLQHGY